MKAEFSRAHIFASRLCKERVIPHFNIQHSRHSGTNEGFKKFECKSATDDVGVVAHLSAETSDINGHDRKSEKYCLTKMPTAALKL